MRNREVTLDFYQRLLGMEVYGATYPHYLMMREEGVEVHFFLHPELEPTANYAQVYLRVGAIQELYTRYLKRGVPIHPNGALSLKPWGQWEFAVIDPDHNLLTYGQTPG